MGITFAKRKLFEGCPAWAIDICLVPEKDQFGSIGEPRRAYKAEPRMPVNKVYTKWLTYPQSVPFLHAEQVGYYEIRRL